MDNDKKKIIETFYNNVKGKKPDVSGQNVRHDGRVGHWLERQFGVIANADNSADILGYELKNETTSKTTFGDWSANRYIFKHGQYVHLFSGTAYYEKQDSFCEIFGKPNADKGGRYSWSGSPIPKIDGFNDFGQKLIIDDNLDIVAIYSFSEDKRPNKGTVVPQELQVDNLKIAKWFGSQSPTNRREDKSLKTKLEDKFNQKGWFTCKTNIRGEYYCICFGSPINFEQWIRLVKEGVVFFDSGMYQGNKRPYSQWRANNTFWDSLIIERYE